MALWIALFLVVASFEGIMAQSDSSSATAIEATGNVSLAYCLLMTLTVLALAAFIYRGILGIVRYFRIRFCIKDDKQFYDRSPIAIYAWFKTWLLDAPLFKTRHHEKLRLPGNASFGRIPTRIQTVLVLGIIGIHVACIVNGIDWSSIKSVTTLKHLRNRLGTIAVMDLVPLFLMAGRTNPLTQLLGVSHDSFNLLHRWSGRICMVEATAHFVCFLLADYYKEGWKETFASFGSSNLVLSGLGALAAFLFINVQALAPLRQAFYEVFLHIHQFLALSVLVALAFHLQGDSPQKYWLYIVMLLWVVDHIVRWSNLAYRSRGRGRVSLAYLVPLPGDAIRVTLHLSRPWDFKPGQHFFLRFPVMGTSTLFSSHPFSAAWSYEPSSDDPEKALVTSSQEAVHDSGTHAICAIIRGRASFTKKVLAEATAYRLTPDRVVDTSPVELLAWVSGPYGLARSFASYGTVLLFSGGVGITHHLAYVRSLVHGYANATVAARRVSLIWAIQSHDHIHWIRPWLNEICAMEHHREILRIQIFVSRPRSASVRYQLSSAVQIHNGRPNIGTLVDKEVALRVGAMVVSVCGPDSFPDDVRKAVCKNHRRANLDFFEESYSS